MSGEQLEEAEVERLGAAVFEQRRLAHMLRQRGAEIESLQGDRERIAAREQMALEREQGLRRRLRGHEERVQSLTTEVESLGQERHRLASELKQAQYEVRREERRAAKTREAAAKTREAAAAELKQAEYEARRVERRLARVDRDAAEARKRVRVQLDSLHAELSEGLASRDEALGNHRKALRDLHELRGTATESARRIEQSALALGREQREVELLVGLEKERELLLAATERTLGEVARHLQRVRISRSWRWGHAIANAMRAFSFRHRSSRSALDSALGRLDAGKPGLAQDERRT